jgi:hypothetical protein
LPAKAVEALVEVFRRKALLEANALDVTLGVEAVPEAAASAPARSGAAAQTARHLAS